MAFPLFSWFGGKALAADAKSLVAAFARACPPPSQALRAISEKQVQTALQGLYLAAGQCAGERKLGAIGRARLARAVQSELFAAGYPPELVSKVVSALTLNALVKR